MSVHPHPTKGPGWFQVRSRPDGYKGKMVVVVVQGEEKAHAIDQQIKRSPRGGGRAPQLFPIINDTILDYLKYYSLEHLDTTNVTRSLRRWGKYVGKLRFNAVHAGHLERYKHNRLALGVKPVTINKELSALCGLLK